MRRLLVVEDDPDSLEMFSRLLESGGYQVQRCGHAREAIRALEKDTYDLVLADLLLSSHEIDRSWKTIESFVDLSRPAPLGLITGWPVSANEAKRHSVDFVLRKPFGCDDLFDQLAKALNLPDIPAPREAMLREYFSHLERGRYGALAWLCTEDVVYRVPGADSKFANEVHGRAELVAFAEATFAAFQDARFEIASMRPLPTGAIVEYVGSWSDGDVTRSMPGAVMFEFRDDLICRIQVRVSEALS
jgi:two-component system, OmpR family, response regulator VicR